MRKAVLQEIGDRLETRTQRFYLNHKKKKLAGAQQKERMADACAANIKYSPLRSCGRERDDKVNKSGEAVSRSAGKTTGSV
ncbi:hypothetical protein EYF80_035705 [Liparis tanakae]|uniref:Uncharacterized protein n=1 Tax=Liparis tanakae TaxID=230148 RepID=A0A4Z2GMR9_9TELE|nr:hypothetical protein EYF80_035705 [Liparis tanakae]